MILVDSNLPMYLIGAEHPHKIDAQRLLERSIADGEKLVTDVEVLQEILHRYSAIDRHSAIQPCFDALLGAVDEIFPVEQQDVLSARDLVLGVSSLSSRDAIHVAIMQRYSIGRIMSFDRDFDGVPGIHRLF